MIRALTAVPAAAALASCARDRVPPGTLKIGMVTDTGGLGDRSFNDSAYTGLIRAKERFGVYTTVLQSRSAADYQPNMTVLANKEYDEIFAIGFLMQRDVEEMAARYLHRGFAIIDAIVDLPNVTSVTFKEEEGSFLAGALAAMVTKTKQVAFLGGIDIPLLRKFEAGFAAGVRQIDPSVKFETKYVGSFDDVASGKELGGVLFDQGADIVYVAAGKAGLGAIAQVKTRPNTYVIGVDSDQDAMIPGKILTSMVKRVDIGVFTVIDRVVHHQATSGHLELGLAQHGVGLTDFKYTKDVVTAPRRATLDRLTQLITTGKIVVPYTREGLASFTRVPL